MPDAADAWPKRGAFVTLEAAGALRGCVGQMRANRSLATVVCEMAVAAARDDPRFPPLGAHELPAVHIEISVLSDAEALRPVVPERVTVGRDGLVVRRGESIGVLLPKVATEFGWGSVDFLGAACRKAGLSPRAWSDAATEVFTFQAEVFRE